jgi:hypothetical protein
VATAAEKKGQLHPAATKTAWEHASLFLQKTAAELYKQKRLYIIPAEPESY